MKFKLLVLATAMFVTQQANAIIIIPIPNLAFPGSLGKIRDAFENSSETKALATAGEDKVFGSRYWVWGQMSGKMTQAAADSQAMSRCEASLANAKAQMAGGQPLYNFGSNKCELYKFKNPSLSLPDAPPVVTPAPAVAIAPEPDTDAQDWTAVGSNQYLQRYVNLKTVRNMQGLRVYEIRFKSTDAVGRKIRTTVVADCSKRLRLEIASDKDWETQEFRPVHPGTDLADEVGRVCVAAVPEESINPFAPYPRLDTQEQKQAEPPAPITTGVVTGVESRQPSVIATEPSPAVAPMVRTATPTVPTPTRAGSSVATESTQRTPTGVSKPVSDVVQKMKDLDALHKQGLITRDEYEKKKKQFLDAM